MSHGRTIGEQTVFAPTGTVAAFQSSDDDGMVFVGITEPNYEGEELVQASLRLTVAEAIELAQKLAREAGFASGLSAEVVR